MASQSRGSSVALTMNATTTDISVDLDRQSAGTAAPLRRRRMARLRDATAPQQRGTRLRRDDQSHTPPHGDAVLPHRTPAH